MTTNKHHNATLLELIEKNQDQLDSLRSRKHSENATQEWIDVMDSHWDVEHWLITEVIKPALKEALVNQELKNW